VLATANDVGEQAELLGVYRRLRALRGGRYVLGSRGRVRLAGARVVRGASVSGVLAVTPRRVTGALRLRGTGTLRGRLRVRLEIGSGQGRAAGRLDGQRVRLRFRFPRTSAAA
jgi:hypothetical protein